MPPNIVTLPPGNPGNNPDAGLIALINAIANQSKASSASRSASTAARRLSLDATKFGKELSDEDAKIQAISQFLQGIPKQSSEKELLEGGGGQTVFDSLRGIGTPTQEDPEITQRKEAIINTIPLADPTLDFDNSTGFGNDADDADLIRQQVALDARIAAAELIQLPTGRAANIQNSKLQGIIDRRGSGIDTDVAFDVAREATKGRRSGDEILLPADKETVSPEDIAFKEKNPQSTIPAEDPSLLPGEIRDGRTGGKFTRGLVLPKERQTAILEALAGITPRGINQLLSDPVFGPVIQAALTDQTLGQQILEKLVDVAIQNGDHGKVIEVDGNLFMVDLSGPTPKQVLLTGGVGNSISAITRTKVGTKYFDFLLERFTPTELANNKDKDGKRIDTQRLGATFAQWQIDKDFTRTELALNAAKIYLSSKPLDNFNRVFTATKNIFGTGLTSDASTKAVTDQILVTMFNKLTDPTSVVREGEFARIFELRSIPGKIEAWIDNIQRVLKGGSALSQRERDTIKEFGLIATVNQLLDGGLQDVISLLDENMDALKINRGQAVPDQIRKKIARAEELREAVIKSRKIAAARQQVTGKRQVIPGYMDVIRSEKRGK